MACIFKHIPLSFIVVDVEKNDPGFEKEGFGVVVSCSELAVLKLSSSGRWRCSYALTPPSAATCIGAS
jgi:hypothetical protein